jgi:hypothetical protein
MCTYSLHKFIGLGNKYDNCKFCTYEWLFFYLWGTIVYVFVFKDCEMVNVMCDTVMSTT